ncbi:hypothetical protein GCM10009733_019040 [Nonomuraea maheshkhaliensis]|uniref:Uncharacterized protein n=1 Tax=Nonomuraea maheshkhaliensis TaxID=419590 RepID=A0ABN2EYQ0_9ACTN
MLTAAQVPSSGVTAQGFVAAAERCGSPLLTRPALSVAVGVDERGTPRRARRKAGIPRLAEESPAAMSGEEVNLL